MRGKFSIVVSSLLLTTTVWAQSAPGFPRLGNTFIGAPQAYEDSAYQSQLARLDVVILGAWPGWRGYSGSVTTLERAVGAIKSLSPSVRVFQYVILEAIGQGQGAGVFKEPFDKINAMNWWTYAKGASGSRVLGAWQGSDGPFYEINLTDFAPTDSNGDRWPDWYAKWAVRTYVTPSPSLDGLYTDNVTSGKPEASSDGDWNRDGVTDSAASVTTQTWYRQGYLRLFADLRALMPGKMLIGNLANWGEPAADLTTISGKLNGGIIEGMIGMSWSPETWAGWSATLKRYRKTMVATAAPQLVIFHQLGIPTDYQGMRYGLTTCLMDNGYYGFSSTASSADGDYHTVVWFDEFDANLGQATSPPPTAAWQNGVWRRDFQNGIALVNPKGNGAQTITLEGDFKKLAGKQAPKVNTGQLARAITLQDRDGIVLLRLTSQSKPSAPPSVTIQ